MAVIEVQDMIDDSSLVVAVSVGSVTTLCFVVIVCVCCLRSNDDEDELDTGSLHSISAERSDLKKLHRHDVKERLDSTRSPLLTKKSIKFTKPERKMTVESVQPESGAQSSLNRLLGLRSSTTSDTASSLPGGATAATSTQPRPLTSTPLRGQSSLSLSVTSQPSIEDIEEPPPLPDVHNLGRISFSLNYDFQEMTLNLRILKGQELPAKDFSGTSDPYVKIFLLPDRKHKLETRIKRKCLNPHWNELFAFEGFPYSKLQSRTLYMQVLDYDRFSRDDPIGEVLIPLSEIDLATNQTFVRNLAPCKGHTGKLGELLLSLCYQPTVGRITVVIMKGRELKAKDVTGSSDPYVKIWLMHDGKRVEKKKTTIKMRTLNPVFNESFIFNIPFEKIRHTSLIISVMDYDKMLKNELIGQVVLGSKSGPMEIKHWNQMLAKSRQPIAQWHILKDFS